MISDLSENIRQKTARSIARYVTVVIMIGLALSGVVSLLEARQVYRIALFDFDKRTVTPDPLARHIETMLRQRLQHIEVDHYSGLGEEQRSVSLLQTLDAKGYDLIITRTSDALIIAQHTLFNTPALYTNVNNPLLLGFKSLGPPGGNISGASYYIPIEKHLRIYKAILPSLKKPGFIFDKHNKSHKVEVPESREACAALGLTYEVEFIDDRRQLLHAAKALIDRGADTIIAASSDTIYENIGAFLNEANQKGIPVFSFYKNGVPEGAVAALSSDYFRLAEELLLPMAVSVLERGVSPGTLPAAFLEKNELFVNRRQVQLLGLTIPSQLKREHDVVFIDKEK